MFVQGHDLNSFSKIFLCDAFVGSLLTCCEILFHSLWVLEIG